MTCFQFSILANKILFSKALLSSEDLKGRQFTTFLCSVKKILGLQNKYPKISSLQHLQFQCNLGPSKPNQNTLSMKTVFSTVFKKSWRNTVWKYQDFPIAQFLREINFEESRRSRTTFFCNLRVNEFCSFGQFQKVKKYIKIKIQSLKMC